MRKKFIQLITLSLGLIASANVFAKTPTVCAATQSYSAIEDIKYTSKIFFKTFYGTSEDIYSRISNNNGDCSIVISSDEKTPVLLIRANKTTSANVAKIAKAPLILWSANKELFKNGNHIIKEKKLKSLAIPKAELTPVGFSAHEVAKLKSFPTDYLKHNLYRADHEYAVFSLVESGNVQTGFLTKPLILKDGVAQGSYWFIQRDYYAPIYYYATLLKNDNSKDTIKLFNFLKSKESLESFIKAGFESIDKID